MGFFKKALGLAVGAATGFVSGGPLGAIAGGASGLVAGIGADKQAKAEKNARAEGLLASQSIRDAQSKANAESARLELQKTKKAQQISARSNQARRNRTRGGLLGSTGIDESFSAATRLGG